MMLGLPGKMGMSGARVWEYFQRGQVSDIRAYCETDVLNTFLVYLQFERMRGLLDESAFSAEKQRLVEFLKTAEENHLREFLSQWLGDNGSA